MTLDARQIERIVREVLQSMQQRVEHPSKAAEGVVPVEASESANLARGNAPQGTPDHGPSLSIFDHVVTVAGLDGRLQGIHELRVGSRAIVTPLVHDVLRERKIKLTRMPPSQKASETALCLRRVLDVDDPTLARSLLDPIPVRWLDVSDWRDGAMKREGDLAAYTLVYSQQWARIGFEANQQCNLRAAAVCDLESVHQAWEQIQPTMLIVNSLAVTPQRLARIAVEFVHKIKNERDGR